MTNYFNFIGESADKIKKFYKDTVHDILDFTLKLHISSLRFKLDRIILVLCI